MSECNYRQFECLIYLIYVFFNNFIVEAPQVISSIKEKTKKTKAIIESATNSSIQSSFQTPLSIPISLLFRQFCRIKRALIYFNSVDQAIYSGDKRGNFFLNRAKYIGSRKLTFHLSYHFAVFKKVLSGVFL
jgi:hypothetical protein